LIKLSAKLNIYKLAFLRQPFNLFLDKMRDPKEIQEDVLKKRLKTLHPFKGDTVSGNIFQKKPLSFRSYLAVEKRFFHETD
jgi:hypothetical protein